MIKTLILTPLHNNNKTINKVQREIQISIAGLKLHIKLQEAIKM